MGRKIFFLLSFLLVLLLVLVFPKKSEAIVYSVPEGYESKAAYNVARAQVDGWLGDPGADISIIYQGKEIAKFLQDYDINSWLPMRENEAGAIESDVDLAAIRKSLSDKVAPEVENRETRLDLDETARRIRITLNQPNDRVVEIATYNVPPPPDPEAGKYRGVYVDIDLTTQTLTVYNFMEVVLGPFKTSTGRQGMDTPTGRFYIRDKAGTVKCLPSKEYKTCIMPLTQHFTSQGHAIHELPIINGKREGERHLGRRVSHGCIRLGIGPAEMFYDFVSVGTPVFVHD